MSNWRKTAQEAKKNQKLGDRNNAGKSPLSRIDPEILYTTANVLAFGSIKYDWNNWRKGFTYHEIIDSMLRHTYALASGEDIDPESGLSHTGHIVCNAMFLARFLKDKRSDLDNRYKGENNG